MGHTDNSARHIIKNCLNIIDVYHSFLKTQSKCSWSEGAFVETEVRGPKCLAIHDSSTVSGLWVFFFFFSDIPFIYLCFQVSFPTTLFVTTALTCHWSSLVAVLCTQSERRSSLPGCLRTKGVLGLPPPHRKAEPMNGNFIVKAPSEKKKGKKKVLQGL